MERLENDLSRYTLLLSREMRKRIGIAAAKAERSLADWIRDAMLEQLARDEKREILDQQKKQTN